MSELWRVRVGWYPSRQVLGTTQCASVYDARQWGTGLKKERGHEESAIDGAIGSSARF